MQGDRETPTPLHTAKCTYDHDKLLLSYPPLQTTLTSNEGHLLLALIEGVTDKEDLISRVWGDRGSLYRTAVIIKRSTPSGITSPKWGSTGPS